MHDSLGQQLNVINIFLESLRTMDRNSPKFDKFLERIIHQNASSVQTLRDVSSNIMPAYILENDLFEVIDQLVQNLNLVNHSVIKFNYKKTKLAVPSKEKELLLYRIIQEFLTNSIKYSKAKNITLTIKSSIRDKVFVFELRDDGVGFDEKKLKHKNGLNTMVHRLHILNANYELKSKLSEGTFLNFKYYV